MPSLTSSSATRKKIANHQVDREFHLDQARMERTSFRRLALGVLLQNKDDYLRQIRGRRNGSYNQPIVNPKPKEWIESQECKDWCAMAEISYEAYKRALEKEAMKIMVDVVDIVAEVA